jgi:hypothetical protein
VEQAAKFLKRAADELAITELKLIGPISRQLEQLARQRDPQISGFIIIKLALAEFP